ncbi:hypothetical protein [Sutterella sp.]|uniref:hypothetical protein n=1 Tax=Sutterella sp. TaxID=1981025 RepID=UPI003FD77787
MKSQAWETSLAFLLAAEKVEAAGVHPVDKAGKINSYFSTSPGALRVREFWIPFCHEHSRS